MHLNTGIGQKDLAGYHRFLDATGCLYRSSGNMVQFSEWGHGKSSTLFAFSNVANGRHDDSICSKSSSNLLMSQDIQEHSLII